MALGKGYLLKMVPLD